ncbi:MAG: MBL fold metallo-hydrolase RNA specificity domain-containing protein, partial [Pseudomonadota bacterium]|nr:MBL fold metallo-hydrolase RNA specificity domain-containing protein [Pseudomonadota bacterium]
LSHFTKQPKVYLVHGEDGAKQELQSAIREKGWNVTIPQLNDTIRF